MYAIYRWGAVTFVVTINQGQVSVDAGSITAGNVLLDFYHSNLNMGMKFV